MQIKSKAMKVQPQKRERMRHHTSYNGKKMSVELVQQRAKAKDVRAM